MASRWPRDGHRRLPGPNPGVEKKAFKAATAGLPSGWIAKDIINMDPTRPRDLGAMLAEAVRESNIEIDIVCGPAIGGVICAQYTALALGVSCVFAERIREDGVERFDQQILAYHFHFGIGQLGFE